MLRPNANTDDVSHDPFPPGQRIDDFQLPGRLDWSVSFEHSIQSLVRIHLEELRHTRWKFAPLLHSLEDQISARRKAERIIYLPLPLHLGSPD